MVLPLLLGVSAVGGGLAWILDKGNLLDADAVGEDIGEAIGTGAEILIDTIPPIMARVGPALVEGAVDTVEATREALRGREAAFMAGITMFFIGWASIRVMKQMTAPRFLWPFPGLVEKARSVEPTVPGLPRYGGTGNATPRAKT